MIGEWQGDAEFQLGNYQHRRAKGMINIPVNDQLAMRFAGVWVDRDGYTENVVDGSNIDGRDQWSLRGSVTWQPTDRTTIDLIGHVFEEDSDRSRSQKQLCTQDPSPILGCVLSDELGTDPTNPFATSGTLLSSNLVLGPFGLSDVFTDPVPDSDQNPDNLRQVRADIAPDYSSDENFVMLEVNHDLNEWLSTTFIASYQDTTVRSVQDYTGNAGELDSVTVPDGWCAYNPASCSFFGTQDGGPLWRSVINDAPRSLGAMAGEFDLSSRGGSSDLSLEESEQYSMEWRFNSHHEGPLNFMLSGYYLDFDRRANYFTNAVTLDWPAVVLATQDLTDAGLIDPQTQFATLAPSSFNSDTASYELESWAVFGEVYYDITPELQLTVGLRRTVDNKSLQDRQLFLNVPVVTDVTDGSMTYLGSDGSMTPVESLIDLTQAAAATGDFTGDPAQPGQEFREESVTFREWTGRIVLDWMPDLEATDSTLFYVSYGRGYKGGGLNPPIDPNLFPDTAASFDPEKINAWEIGTKNALFDNRLQANFNLFYYDYDGLQIGTIVNRTSLNENTDADIWGAEAEFVLAPDENWLFNASVSYLNTELGDTETVDPRDPTQGRDDVTLLKDLEDASNCVVGFAGQGPVSENQQLMDDLAAAGIPYFATGDAGGNMFPETPGVTDSALTSCAAMEGIVGAYGYEWLEGGVTTNLEGNELLNSPEWTVSLGAQYTHYFDNGMSLTGRVDYYWQDSFYATTFNRAQDRVDSYGLINAQVTLSSMDDRWYLRGFVRNLRDKDALSGTYSTDGSSGLFTNAFLVEPRLYGATVGMRF